MSTSVKSASPPPGIEDPPAAVAAPGAAQRMAAGAAPGLAAVLAGGPAAAVLPGLPLPADDRQRHRVPPFPARRRSIFGEEWVGLRYVRMFISDPTFWQVFPTP